ncbi:hypothetical protein [Oleiphilus sp. HI0086]|nr:hypothetical protein [Oleiphilus sp. HI0086]KZY43603.1 hypothetical protein A3732_01975 [Oleiphilus sp. HI0050]KZZ39452.1 hypothetical protein A3756_08465 [Oleiphilus sp. HI0086]
MDTENNKHILNVLDDEMYGATGVIPPDRDATLWRFMSFAKFLSLLESESLYLTRIDGFDDKFEGAFPKKALEKWNATTELLRQANDSKEFSDSYWERLRKNTFVQCWHMNSHESDGMWKLYGHIEEAVAIKTKAIKLLRAIHRDYGLFIGKVFYVDYDNDLGFPPVPSPVEPFFYKRKSFEHEKEVRVLIQQLFEPHYGREPLSEYGRNLSVDLELLIEEIVIAPFAPAWLFELMQSVVKRYGLDPSLVKRSVLNEAPSFPA